MENPTRTPVISVTDDTAVLAANGNDITRVSLAYIGAEDMTIGSWSQFEAAGKVYTDINGKNGCIHYNTVSDGDTWELGQAGYYAIYVRYINLSGAGKTVYFVVDGENTAQ